MLFCAISIFVVNLRINRSLRIAYCLIGCSVPQSPCVSFKIFVLSQVMIKTSLFCSFKPSGSFCILYVCLFIIGFKSVEAFNIFFECSVCNRVFVLLFICVGFCVGCINCALDSSRIDRFIYRDSAVVLLH